MGAKRVFLALSLFLGIAPAQPTGSVIGIAGKWRDAKGPLHFGSPVSGDPLKCDPESTIMIAWGDARIFGRCDRSGAFRPKDAPRQDEPKSLWARLKTAVSPYTRRNPDALVAAVSRDFGREVREAVVSAPPGAVDVAPAFRDALPGPYRLRLTPFSAPPLPPQSVQWIPGKPLPLALTLEPGLYRLEVIESGGTTGSDAWILAAPATSYAATAADFDSLLTLASQWAEDLDSASMRPLLRAYLEYLAGAAKP